MPVFALDTSGDVMIPKPGEAMDDFVCWDDLTPFEQGYIEALFFTESAPGVTTEEWQGSAEHDEGSIPGDVGFADLAPETLARIIDDCRRFQAANDMSLRLAGISEDERADLDAGHAVPTPDAETMTQLGRDFWYTRNGHGVGFWDGDWPEPYAAALTDAADAFGPVDAYLGDDGKVYLS